jgi:hypothetical protein
VESWRARVDRMNDLGEELIREFPEHNPSDIRLTSHRDTQRYNKLVSRYVASVLYFEIFKTSTVYTLEFER